MRVRISCVFFVGDTAGNDEDGEEEEEEEEEDGLERVSLRA